MKKDKSCFLLTYTASRWEKQHGWNQNTPVTEDLCWFHLNLHFAMAHQKNWLFIDVH